MSVRLSAGPTVGREPELAQLEAALDGLTQGESGCVAVEGEPGIGKTRLLGELRRRAEERGLPRPRRRRPPSSSATCRSASGSTRWTPTSWPSSCTSRSRGTPTSLDELAAVLPSLKRPGGGAGPPSLADERFRAHRAVRALLEVLARDRPLVADARRPALERRGVARADRGAAAPRHRAPGAARPRVPSRPGPRAPRHRAGRPLGRAGSRCASSTRPRPASCSAISTRGRPR